MSFGVKGGQVGGVGNWGVSRLNNVDTKGGNGLVFGYIQGRL